MEPLTKSRKDLQTVGPEMGGFGRNPSTQRWAEEERRKRENRGWRFCNAISFRKQSKKKKQKMETKMEAEDEDENNSEKPKDRVYCPIYGQIRASFQGAGFEI